MTNRLAHPARILPAGEDFLLLPPARQPVAYADVDAVFATLSCWPQPPYAAAHGIDLRAERLTFRDGVLAALG